MFTPASSLPPALFAAFALFLLAAVTAPLLARRRRAAGLVHLALVATAAVFLLVLGFEAVSGRGMEEARVLRLGPLSVPVLLDGLAGLFLIVIAFMAVMSAFYAVRYMDQYRECRVGGFHAAFPLFVAGLAALVVVDDLSAGFTLAWQVMTVASFFLIRYERRNAANVRAANKYLILMEAAWLLVLAGGFAAGGAIGDSFREIGLQAGGSGGGPTGLAFALLLVGFGLMAGLFPFGRFWLPDAQAAAPDPVNVLLSGALLNIGVLGLFRVFFILAPAAAAFDTVVWGALLAAAGVLTLFIGTLQSVRQSDVARLLAYSSIGQTGYVVLALGVSLWTAAAADPAVRALSMVAVLGALFHVLNHSALHGLLFMTSGGLRYMTGTRDLNKLGGLITLMPVSAAVAAFGSLSISGMPATSGFASKETIIAASLMAGAASPALVIFGIVALFTSAVTLACFVKFFGLAFTSSGSRDVIRAGIREVPALMLIPQIVLGVLALVQGLIPTLFLGAAASAVGRSAGFVPAGAMDEAPGGHVDPLTALIVLGLLLAAILIAAFLRRSAGAGSRAVPTWLCGYQTLGEGNRFTDRGMFAALKHFFRWTGGR